MHPAPSVILFTTASGLGYGLLAALGLYAAAGLVPADPWLGALGLGLAIGLVTLGLLSSTFHLGHPERAWRALSQWRSSWLSREGVAAVATYPPALAFAWLWVMQGRIGGLAGMLGLLAAAGAGLTVYCTGMIYASLPAVPRWHSRWVVPGYLAFALMTGLLAFEALTLALGAGRPEVPYLAIAALGASALIKACYWRETDRAKPAATAASATGLGPGEVRLFEAPHTAGNYLTDEMGFRVARRHAAKLRRLVFALAFAAPLALLLLRLALGGAGAAALAVLALLAAMVGVAIERWLFFAEAEHVVTLYYGRSRV